MSTNEKAFPVWRKRSTRADWIAFGSWVLALAFVSWTFQVMTQDTIWAFVADAPAQMEDIGTRMMPPAWSFIHELWWPLWETINIATLGTLIGLVMAVPVAFLAARNTTPSARFVRPVALLVIVASRSINSLIWALLLVAILGPGVLAGILAIALRSIGFIGKLLYESIEEIDGAQVEAIEATGASSAQTMAWGVVPQVAPTLAGVTVFRWDINIRESTVLGLVGAGGIGVKLEAALGTLAWPKVTMLLIVILATVVVSEWVTAQVRRKLI
ncbi:MAG TPA: phosphonate ABC transporter, permease protein PhnE [Hydrogenophaga sp.]|uniref:phosphonate ABC transporter, permease protein PhnE n=1 Tax=Hydrogenophaga sp. TaxID=1904254 RepID=UPI002CCF2C77|nr:phosphonate ABC transporter, permease protein PhnE [Hydrogenophaga sp.]HMN92665.1 phosphonate ABC transporter, permease protein PhnE [Hydrogenophaga sp.]HMP09248.1 phosphonate ABC transporter, permease protein PhnE [Hydrogenophaga sp.]